MSTSNTRSPPKRKSRADVNYAEGDDQDDDDDYRPESDEEPVGRSGQASSPKRGKAGPSTSKSPRSPAAKKVKTSTKPPATDPSTWRSTNIPPGTEISKGDSTLLYRLTQIDRNGLAFRTHVARSGFTAHLYQEREVERRAWGKHGSPEGWDAYLDTQRAKRKPKTPGLPFPEPTRYGSSAIPATVAIMTLPNDPSLQKMPPEWWDLKARFSAPWLWDACVKYLNNPEREDTICVRDQIVRLREALGTFKGKYPLRPTTRLASSPSVDNLRDVLARAPRQPESEYDATPEGVQRSEDHELNVYFDWDKAYRDEVHSCLIAIINELGASQHGWATARWEVYDKYAESMKGINYYTGGRYDSWWCDDAKVWLSGWIHPKHSGLDWQHRDTELGRTYNDLLRERGVVAV